MHFNSGFKRLIHWYVGTVSRVVDRRWLFVAICGAICVLTAVLFIRLPTGFLPSEDQGAVSVQFRLPPGATLARTQEVQRAIENYFLQGPEKKNVSAFFTVAGGGQGLAGQNVGQAFISLADYDTRRGSENGADASSRSSRAFLGSGRALFACFLLRYGLTSCAYPGARNSAG